MDRRSFLAGAGAAALAACSRNPAKRMRLALNWKPEPEFGGFYAANYKAHGLDVEILPGGVGTPTVQMVGAGQAEFGIVSADEVVLARAQENDVVALFAVYQNCPQGIMVHTQRGLQSIGEVTKSGTLAVQKGIPYVRLLERKYPFDKVKVVPSPGGDVTAFLADKEMAQQCYIFSEPLTAKRQGASVRVFPVTDLGYNPYATVLITSGALLNSDEENATKMVQAVREGWKMYLANPKPTNEVMNKLNPSMELDEFTEIAGAQKSFIETPDTAQEGLGTMSRDRWAALVDTLKSLGDIEEAIAPESCFRLL